MDGYGGAIHGVGRWRDGTGSDNISFAGLEYHFSIAQLSPGVISTGLYLLNVALRFSSISHSVWFSPSLPSPPSLSLS